MIKCPQLSEHVGRVKAQYDQLKTLKDRLPENHAIVQMEKTQKTKADRLVKENSLHTGMHP